MLRTIEHIFFDLDRTLWDFDRNSNETLTELFNELQIGEQTGATAEEFIQVYLPINERYWENYRLEKLTQNQLRTGRFSDALAHFGLVNDELSQAIGEAYVARSPHKTALIDGALDLLNHLNSRYHLHIITNGFEEVQHIKMHASGITPFFKEIITSERAGVKKPNPEIFSFAENLTNAKPEQCLMIGDHFEADIEGASNVDWKSIYFEPMGNKDGNHIHVKSLREIISLL